MDNDLSNMTHIKTAFFSLSCGFVKGIYLGEIGEMKIPKLQPPLML
jgi:hypothetical protein